MTQIATDFSSAKNLVGPPPSQQGGLALRTWRARATWRSTFHPGDPRVPDKGARRGADYYDTDGDRS